MLRLTILLSLTMWLGTSHADWQVVPEGSHIGFASVKNDLIAENHSFTQVSGGVSSDGTATIIVALGSVETLIPIRNERMQQMLFNVSEHAKQIRRHS